MATLNATRLALIGEVSLSVRSYYYFSSSVALFQILKSVLHFAQAFKSPIDNRRDFSRLHEIGEIGEIVVIELRDKKREFLFAQLGA